MILYPELRNFKQQFLLYCRGTRDMADKISETLSAAYEQLLSQEVSQDTPALLADVGQSIRNVKHNIQHIENVTSLIGADQRERYFAIKNGEFQEVSKDEYPPDDDEAISAASEI